MRSSALNYVFVKNIALTTRNSPLGIRDSAAILRTFWNRRSWRGEASRYNGFFEKLESQGLQEAPAGLVSAGSAESPPRKEAASSCDFQELGRLLQLVRSNDGPLGIARSDPGTAFCGRQVDQLTSGTAPRCLYSLQPLGQGLLGR